MQNGANPCASAALCFMTCPKSSKCIFPLAERSLADQGSTESLSTETGLLQVKCKDCLKANVLVPRKNEWEIPQCVQNKIPTALRKSSQIGQKNKASNPYRNLFFLLFKSWRSMLSIDLNLRNSSLNLLSTALFSNQG